MISKIIFSTFLLGFSIVGFAQQKDSLTVQNPDTENFEDAITWPFIMGYEKMIPIGNLSKNMDALDGFHIGFQFKIQRKYILDMRIFGAFGGDNQKRLTFTYKNVDFESYIKSVYGAKVSVIHQKYLIPNKLSVSGSAGLGMQNYNSDKENKKYVLNGVTGQYEESKEQNSRSPIGSATPIISVGLGTKYEFKKFPVGVSVSYNYTPQNLFGKMIQHGTGNSYMSVNIFTGYFIPF